ncbi:MAG: TSUP family transporter, partial [Oleibacter sp.]|nr:TSUP family transporter [Thalassolituus sp.]
MTFSIELLTLFFFAAMIAGCIDAIAGGGGLITLPALLICGVSPAQAIATNKVGAVGGSMSSTFHFVRRGHIDLNNAKLMIAASFVGSFLGSMMLTRIDSSFLSVIIPFLLIGFSLYFLFSPNLGALDRKHLISGLVYSLFVASVIGFYDGFFGPGTGAF